MSSTRPNQGQRTVRTSLLWDLLRYNRSTSGETSTISGETVCLQTTTQFTSPVEEADIHGIDDATSSSSVHRHSEVARPDSHGINDALLVDLDADFLTNTDAIFADIDPDFWSNLGQL